MVIKRFKGAQHKNVILFMEENLNDYLYNTALNLVTDDTEHEQFSLYRTYDRLPSKFYSYDVLFSIKVAN